MKALNTNSFSSAKIHTEKIKKHIPISWKIEKGTMNKEGWRMRETRDTRRDFTSFGAGNVNRIAIAASAAATYVSIIHWSAISSISNQEFWAKWSSSFGPLLNSQGLTMVLQPLQGPTTQWLTAAPAPPVFFSVHISDLHLNLVPELIRYSQSRIYM